MRCTGASTGAGRRTAARRSRQGWKPESGFLHYGWEGYSEAILLYVLALGSPTHPLRGRLLPGMDRDLSVGESLRLRFPVCRAAVHSPVLACMDRFSRHPRSLHAREALRLFREQPARDSTSSANTRGAIRIEFAGYDEDCWGLTACDGPSNDAAGHRSPSGDAVRLCRARRALWARRRNARRLGGAGVAAVRARHRARRRAQHSAALSGDDVPTHRYASSFNPTLLERRPARAGSRPATSGSTRASWS